MTQARSRRVELVLAGGHPIAEHAGGPSPERAMPKQQRVCLPAALALATAIAATGVATAQPSSGAPSPKCAGAEYHAFDFQIGDWVLTDSNGEPGGVIRNTAILGGCAIAEDYFDEASGSRGASTSAWDPATRTWKQYWVSNAGWTLLLEGRRDGDRFVMNGTLPNADTSKPQQQRVTWFIGDDGKVERQLWEQSDDGVQWTSHFDATYRPLR